MDQVPASPPTLLPLPQPLKYPPALRESADDLPAVPDPVPDGEADQESDRAATEATARRAGWGDRVEWRSATVRTPRRKAAPPGSAPKPSTAGAPGVRRFVRTRRGAVGLVIVAAALLLWPFAGLSWIPWLIGFVALVVIRLLRLDGVLRGWDVHLAGVVVVAGLMFSTTLWAWVLAASIGLLIGGLTRLPAWRLAALGVVACLLAGAGYVWSNAQQEQAAIAAYAPVQERSRDDQGASRPNGVLPILLNRIAQGSPGAICTNLLAPPVRSTFAASVGQPDCDAAVRALSAQVTDTRRYSDADARAELFGNGSIVDACKLDWGATPAGPQIGYLTISAVAPSRYLVTDFRPC